MKTFSLLGHIFETEDNAYLFLESYVERIKKYAHQHNVSSDIIDDIFYNIIEKLYAGGVPVTEQHTISLANDIGEPETIFGEPESPQEDVMESKKWRIQREKPLIWGVCYWIAKSLGVPVTRVRIAFIITFFFRGAAFFLYIILALFVPYKEKSKTTGRIGNFAFEIVRIALWLAVISTLVPIVGGVMLATGLVFFTPAIHNQSFAAWIPAHMYRALGIACVSLFMLLIGSLGGLFKQKWITKTVALLSFIGLFVSALVAGGTMYQKFLQLEMYEDNFTTSTVLTGANRSDTLTLDIKDIENDFAWTDVPLAENRIEVVANTGDQVVVTIETALRAPSEEQKEANRKYYAPVNVSENNGTVTIDPPIKVFTQQVPFAFVRRHITISVPQDKKIVVTENKRFLRNLNNRYYNSYEDGQGNTTTVSCADDNTSYSYSGAIDSFFCDKLEVETEATDNDWDDKFDIEDQIEKRVEDRIENRLEGFEGNYQQNKDNDSSDRVPTPPVVTSPPDYSGDLSTGN